MNIDHPHICLSTVTNLTDEELLLWLTAVANFAPNGTVIPAFVPESNKQLRFYRRIDQNTNHYIASLSRNISFDEATVIANQFSNNYLNGDFEIRWSQDPFIADKIETASKDLLIDIAREAAKLNHNYWLQKKVSDGWRFSLQHSQVDKTSPMCRDWDHLPESYRTGEHQRIVSLLEILDGLNLRLVHK